MRLIDADKLYKEIDMGNKAANFLLDENDCNKYENINNIDDCLESIRYADAFDLETNNKVVAKKAIEDFISVLAPELEKCWYRCELDMGPELVIKFIRDFLEDKETIIETNIREIDD